MPFDTNRAIMDEILGTFTSADGELHFSMIEMEQRLRELNHTALSSIYRLVMNNYDVIDRRLTAVVLHVVDSLKLNPFLPKNLVAFDNKLKRYLPLDLESKDFIKIVSGKHPTISFIGPAYSIFPHLFSDKQISRYLRSIDIAPCVVIYETDNPKVSSFLYQPISVAALKNNFNVSLEYTFNNNGYDTIVEVHPKSNQVYHYVLKFVKPKNLEEYLFYYSLGKANKELIHYYLSLPEA